MGNSYSRIASNCPSFSILNILFYIQILILCGLDDYITLLIDTYGHDKLCNTDDGGEKGQTARHHLPELLLHDV